MPLCLLLRLVCALLIGFSSFNLHAQFAKGPVTVEADSAQINAKTGAAQYKGNVIVQHPEITITSESIELIDDGTKRYFFASGPSSQVTWRHPKGTSTGTAEHLVFKEDLQQKFFSMKGNASVFHQGNRVQGHWFFYNFLTGELNVSSQSPSNGKKRQPKATESKRIKVILQQK